MLIHGNTKNSIANATTSAENTSASVRLTRRGEQFVMPITSGLYGIAEEGSYFKAVNPTIGTGIAQGIQTTFSATANVLMTIRNTDAVGGKNIYLDYLRLINTVAGATTTQSRLAVTMDLVNRYSTGGTNVVGVSPRSDVANDSVASIFFGAVTATAVSTPRTVANVSLKVQAAPCWLVGDEVFLNFGAQDSGTSELNGSVVRNIAKALSPVIIAPGSTALIHLWNVANATTAPSWEFDLGYWVR